MLRSHFVIALQFLFCLNAARCLVTLQNPQLTWIIDDSNCSSSIVSDAINFTVHGAWSIEIAQTQAQYDAGVIKLLQPRVSCFFLDSSSNSSLVAARWSCPWLAPEREEPVDLYVTVIHELLQDWFRVCKVAPAVASSFVIFPQTFKHIAAVPSPVPCHSPHAHTREASFIVC
jgi:hypothetical protein